jgi:small subunit ribosomal protein S13
LSSQEYRHIVRIAGKDILGTKKTIIGISQVKGMGYNFAKSILDILKINPNSNIGFLTESQVEEIEKIMKNPSVVSIPSWFLNRRKDIDSGKDLHLITSDIDFNVRNDIEREKTMSSWRGFRHTYGLKVRGQRTRTTGRKGGAVGVRKGGKVLPAGAPAEGEAPAASGQAAATTAVPGQPGTPAATAAKGVAVPAKDTKAPAKDTKVPATKPTTEKKAK